jgi:hypothetical protein
LMIRNKNIGQERPYRYRMAFNTQRPGMQGERSACSNGVFIQILEKGEPFRFPFLK